MYPKLVIDSKKLTHNTKQMVELAKKHDATVMGVSKCFCAYPEAVTAMVKGGIKYLADSRIENLRANYYVDIEKVLLRGTPLSQVEDVIRYVDISLNSELETIKALDAEAKKQEKIHKIILMIDLGDLREGIFFEDNVIEVVKEIISLENINLFGLGVNFSCYGGVIAKHENTKKLVDIRDQIKEELNYDIELLTGGNSSSIHLLQNNKLPSGINNLRLGEVLLLGRETAYGELVPGMNDDAFTLEAEIIELQEKPSYPIGEIGMDAFGNVPVIEDKGIMKRGILSIGRQDVDLDGLMPFDINVEVIGASSDHLIVDLTKAEYKLGDIIKFKLDYGALLNASTSLYVNIEMKD